MSSPDDSTQVNTDSGVIMVTTDQNGGDVFFVADFEDIKHNQDHGCELAGSTSLTDGQGNTRN